MLVNLWENLAFIVAVLVGLAGFVWGVYLVVATDEKRAGLFVLLFEVVFFLCPLIVFILVVGKN